MLQLSDIFVKIWPGFDFYIFSCKLVCYLLHQLLMLLEDACPVECDLHSISLQSNFLPLCFWMYYLWRQRSTCILKKNKISLNLYNSFISLFRLGNNTDMLPCNYCTWKVRHILEFVSKQFLSQSRLIGSVQIRWLVVVMLWVHQRAFKCCSLHAAWRHAT